MSNFLKYIQVITEGIGNTLNKYHYTGSCVNSFDEDGECVNGLFDDINDFANAEEYNSVEISEEEFLSKVEISEDLSKYMDEQYEPEYLTINGIYTLYALDEDGNDIHYFFD